MLSSLISPSRSRQSPSQDVSCLSSLAVSCSNSPLATARLIDYEVGSTVATARDVVDETSKQGAPGMLQMLAAFEVKVEARMSAIEADVERHCSLLAASVVEQPVAVEVGRLGAELAGVRLAVERLEAERQRSAVDAAGAEKNAAIFQRRVQSLQAEMETTTKSLQFFLDNEAGHIATLDERMRKCEEDRSALQSNNDEMWRLVKLGRQECRTCSDGFEARLQRLAMSVIPSVAPANNPGVQRFGSSGSFEPPSAHRAEDQRFLGVGGSMVRTNSASLAPGSGYRCASPATSGSVVRNSSPAVASAIAASSAVPSLWGGSHMRVASISSRSVLPPDASIRGRSPMGSQVMVCVAGEVQRVQSPERPASLVHPNNTHRRWSAPDAAGQHRPGSLGPGPQQAPQTPSHGQSPQLPPPSPHAVAPPVQSPHCPIRQQPRELRGTLLLHSPVLSNRSMRPLQQPRAARSLELSNGSSITAPAATAEPTSAPLARSAADGQQR